MPIVVGEHYRQIVARAIQDIRVASDADANEQGDVEAKYQRRELIADFEAEQLGVDR